MSSIPISVVITTYDDDARLGLTLSGFKKQKDAPPFEVVVVNDGGDHKTEGLVKSFGFKYAYLNPPSPDFRLAAARNLGMQYTIGNRIVICDCDTIPNERFIQQHAAGDQSKVYAGVRKRIDIPRSEALFGRTDWNEATLETMFYCIDERVANKDYLNLNKNPQPWMYTWGCNFSFPAQPALDIGGFDAEFVGWGGEDEDIANRLYRVGVPFQALPECVVYHLDHKPRTAVRAAATFARKLGGPILRNGGPLRRLEYNGD